jgi:hypothetical protein
MLPISMDVEIVANLVQISPRGNSLVDLMSRMLPRVCESVVVPPPAEEESISTMSFFKDVMPPPYSSPSPDMTREIHKETNF